MEAVFEPLIRKKVQGHYHDKIKSYLMYVKLEFKMSTRRQLKGYGKPSS